MGLIGNSGFVPKVPKQATTAEKTAGTETAKRSFSPKDIADMAAAHHGTINHAGTSNRAWTASGHTGTPNKVPGFDENGAAKELSIGTDLLSPNGSGAGLSGVVKTETDPVVGAVNGIVKANGAGAISAAQSGSDYLSPIVTINDQSGTTYTFVLTDLGKYVRCTNANAIAITVPAYADVAFPIGSVVTVEQGGAGQITVAGDSGVTVNGYNSGLKTAGQYACVQLIKTAENVWTLIGGTT